MPIVIGGGSVTGLNSLSGNLSVSGYANVTQGLSTAGLYTSGTANVTQGLTTASRGINNASVPSGSILQVSWNAMSGTYSGSGSSLRDTGLGASFTPLYSTSRVLHIVTTGAVFICDGQLCIARNGSVVSPSLQDSYRDGITGSYTVDVPVYAFTWIDSPSTTSSITYRLFAAATGCGQSIWVGNTDGTGSWLMMELAA